MNTGLTKLTHAAGFVLLALAAAVARDRIPAQLDGARFYKHARIHVHRNPDGSAARDVLNRLQSANWSGYAVASYATSVFYTSAKMSWVLPAVSYGFTIDTTRSPEYSSNWVGIGGFCQDYICSTVDPTLIQLGTGQVVAQDGETLYYAWYEILPQPETPLNLSTHPVAPGDVMKASLSCIANCNQPIQTWKLKMKDKTQGWSWSKKISYGASLQSVEWIEEAPFSGVILPLANFATARFSAKGGANGLTPSLTYWDNGIQLGDFWGQTSNPSTPDAFAEFNACWGFEVYVSCPAP